MSKKFNKDHIDGDHGKNKMVNHVGDFDQGDKRYRSVRESGDGSGSRMPGTRDGQKWAVVDDINHRGTGKQNHGQEGKDSFFVVGQKDKKSYKPEHLVGPATKTKDGKYKDKDSTEYSECSSSTSAYYEKSSE